MSSDALDVPRLERLIEAGRALVSEFELPVVLDRVLQTAREVTGAKYAALGVLHQDRRSLSEFITRGVDDETRRAIGDLPRGRGILGVLIEDPRPLRLDSVGDDPRSYGFPAGHPPMGSFLGVPVLMRGEAWGNLYLTEKEGGQPFSASDERSIVVLADWAAIAIENAGLYRAVEGRRDELERAVRGFEASAAIARAIGDETDLDRVLELVAQRGRALVSARAVLILLSDGEGLVVAAEAGHAAPEAVSRVTAAAQAVLADSDFSDRDGALLVPLRYRDRTLGVLAALSRDDQQTAFTADDEAVLGAFAAQAATAVATARSVAAVRLRHSLDASEAERKRWARELHDETLQGLGGLRVLLSSALRRDGHEALREAVETAIGNVSGEIDNLRALIAELRPAALDQLGLEPALRSLIGRTEATQGLETEAIIELGATRLSPELETSVYRLVQEALTNVGKHAGATRVEVEVMLAEEVVGVEVRDDGRGFDASRQRGGFGLLGMRERVALAGGRLHIGPGGAGGTVVRAELPASG